ncbi:hypothetical protein Peur_028618 [Populus x canadensis]
MDVILSLHNFPGLLATLISFYHHNYRCLLLSWIEYQYVKRASSIVRRVTSPFSLSRFII